MCTDVCALPSSPLMLAFLRNPASADKVPEAVSSPSVSYLEPLAGSSLLPCHEISEVTFTAPLNFQ